MPKTESKFIKQISVKLTEEQYAEAVEKFKQSGLKNKGHYFRDLVLTNKTKVVQKDYKLENKKLFLLSKVSNNINQIAYKLNVADLKGKLQEEIKHSLLLELENLSNLIIAELVND